jgi:hypothetical protein
MTKNRPPAPPVSDNPIIFLRSMSETTKLAEELDFLTEVLDAHAAGDVDRAARCVIAALTSTMPPDMTRMAVGLVNNLAHSENHYPLSVKNLLCKAADLGLHKYAYNAANQIMKGAKSVKAYREAERYFKLAMAFDEMPDLQAAAHVNYCEIVRDGLISGTPDWPAAVEIYETAARMGLVKAMFNAGNVSSWLADRKGDEEYGARAAYWFKYALDYRDAGKPRLDMETLEELGGVFDQCILALSACHIDSKFDGAELEEGVRWARTLADRGNFDGRRNLAVAYRRRLEALSAKPQRSPGANWRSTLFQMDWRFKGDVTCHTVSIPARSGRPRQTKVDKLSLDVGGGPMIPLFVTHDPCLPLHGGIELLCDIAEVLAGHHPEGFFLLARKALFMESDQAIYTPIWVFHERKFSPQSLWTGASPQLLLQNAAAEVDFLDERFGNSGCMLPIAANILDEGFVVADDPGRRVPWVGVGGSWRMPFVDQNQLAGLGIELGEPV